MKVYHELEYYFFYHSYNRVDYSVMKNITMNLIRAIILLIS